MKRIYLIGLILATSFTLNAQNKDTKAGDENFKNLEYAEAIDEYTELVEDGEATPYVYKRLAQANYILYNTKEAERYYAIVVTQDNAEAEDFYRYAEMLKANGKLSESQAWMRKFVEMAPNDKRAIAFQKNPNYVSDIQQMESGYVTEEMDINTDGFDFGGYFHEGKLYFVSARNKSRNDFGYQQPTLDIYVTQGIDGVFGEAQLLEGEVNSKFNEGTVAITADGQTMYFTRNDYFEGDYEASEEGIGELKIYRAKWVNGEWAEIDSLSINNSQYSTGHPALSPDGNTLYFSSAMPGGEGASDLYKVSINEDGSLGQPESLGAEINTPGRESFPFIDKDGNLYFSSDGHLGLGGLDVFKAEAQGEGFGKLSNVGTPVNSPGDDFAFAFYEAEKLGFVSSNRGAEGSNDNIYLLRPIEKCETDLIVTVIDADTKAPIAGANVKVYAPGGEAVASAATSPEGISEFTVECDTYEVQADAEGYFSESETAPKQERGKTLELTIELSPEPVITETEVVLNPIYFEFDKADITPEAALELDRLVRVMEEHPDMVIQVRAHTDFRGSDAYNLDLSDRRAKSTAQYIISQGIDESRITGKGFGETMPEIECGGNCTEEQHATNRRSEFMIVGGDVTEKKG